MDLSDAESQQIREVYARFGLAMYQAQCVERQIAILLATCFNRAFGLASPAERERVLDAEFARTLGGLVSQLSQRIRIPASLEQRIERALEVRNLLAHNYFWERAGQFLSSQGRQSMIEELTQYGSELNSLDATLTDIARQWSAKAGITEEMIEAGLQRLRSDGDA